LILSDIWFCRKIHESATAEKIASVNEKLQIATSTLQQAIGGVSQNLNVTNDKVCTWQIGNLNETNDKVIIQVL
jgi:hypothetical protein